MHPKITLTSLMLLFALQCLAQGNEKRRPITGSTTFLNYYPTALVVKDVSFGVERKLDQKILLETTLAWHCLTGSSDFYQQGDRFDLMPKYAFYTNPKFECTVVSDLFFQQYFSRDAWFTERVILMNRNQQAPDPLYRSKENKTRKTAGLGLGFGFRYGINKHFSICSENFLTYSKTTIKQTITQIEYNDTNANPRPIAPELGSISAEFPMRLGFRSTLKISYALGK